MKPQFSKITAAVDKHRDRILAAERYIWAHPETGYREYLTTEYMANEFRALGYTLTMAEGITGFYTVLDTGREGPEVLILGELDSIICPTHKEADPVTGAVHSCGHHAQCATLLGIAAALKEPGMLDGLCGRIRLCAVPAEELLELEFRGSLRREGKIRYFGGKSEFLSRGYFDGVDIAFLVHTTTGESYVLNNGHVGCLTKSITYRGKAAHAGGEPEKGINALYAANCGLNAVNAIRETFRDTDQIRVHPIVTAGGDMVNAIPETVRLESYVRGATFDAITDANRRVNRALVGAALSLGANVDIVDVPGYAPNNNDPVFSDLAEAVFSEILPERRVLRRHVRGAGSTDMGDLSAIMPTIQPYAPGAIGTSHGNDYYLVDPEVACVDNAKWQLAILFALLENGGAEARRIMADFKPTFESAEAFLAYMDSLHSSGERITYTEGGAEVRL